MNRQTKELAKVKEEYEKKDLIEGTRLINRKKKAVVEEAKKEEEEEKPTTNKAK